MEFKYRFIYKTTNLINGKIYVGQHSTNKFNDGYLGSGTRFNNSIKKYGKENFIREILEFCNSIEELDKKEEFWIKELDSKNRDIGYNITNGGKTVTGMIHSEESKRKISLSGKGKHKGELNHMYGKTGDKNYFYGKTHTEEVKLKISSVQKGKKRTEEQKKQQSLKLKGRPLSEEHKNNLKKSSKRGKDHHNYGKDPWNKGKKWESKVRENIGKANTGKKRTEEERLKISNRTKGINNPNYGVKTSEDKKLKISNSLKEYYKNKKLSLCI